MWRGTTIYEFVATNKRMQVRDGTVIPVSFAQKRIGQFLAKKIGNNEK